MHLRAGLLPVLIVALVGLFSVRHARAQDSTAADTSGQPVHLEARTLTGTIVEGEPVRRLTGDVRLRQGQTRLRADRAIQYTRRSQITFTGDVLIVERGDSLRADTVRYDSQDKVGRATGHVRLSDGDVVVHAPSGRYHTRQKEAYFNDGLRLIDSLTVITSRAGTYFSGAERAEFFGNVELEHTDARLLADSVTYYRERDVSDARGSVFIERWGDAADSTAQERTYLFGGRAHNNEQTGRSRIWEQPLLMHVRPDSNSVDTLLIRASVLEVNRSDSLRRLTAVDSVRIWQNQFAAVADSAVHDRFTVSSDSSRDETRLFRSPVAWFQTTQISGDSLRVKGRAGALDSLFVYQNAFAAQRDTALDRINQLRGKHIVGLFADSDLRQLNVGPLAESIYYLSNNDDRPGGAVEVSGDSIRFDFEDEKLRQIHVLAGVKGTHYPVSQLPSSLQLSGYRWIPDRRPTKEGLLEVVPAPRPPRRGTPPPAPPGEEAEELPSPPQAQVQTESP